MRALACAAATLFLVACGGTLKTEGEPDTSTDPTEEEVAPDPLDDGACTVDADCDDGDPCTDDVCDPDTGACTNEEIAPDEDEDGYISDECGGDDCDDSDPEVHPGAEEVCLDGIDNDCDGEVDGPAVLPSDVQVTDSDGAALMQELHIVWTGSLYGLAWVDDRDGNAEIYFARISPEATVVGTDTRITDAGGSSFDPSLAWTGSEFGLSWFDDRDGNTEVYFTRIDGDGAKVGADVRITNNSGASDHAFIGWSGSEYGIVWSDDREGNEEIYFVRVSPTGSRTGTDVRVTDATGSSDHPSVQWTGSEFCVAWDDARDGGREIFFARLEPDGTKIGSDVQISGDAASSSDPSLCWTGAGFGVVWTDYRDTNDEIYFARISEVGEKVGSDVRITDDRQADRESYLAWTGSEYGVVWEYWHGYSDCEYARITPTGEVIEAYFLVPDGSAASSYQPSIAWSGSEYGVGLMEYRDFDDNVFFNRIGFCE
jgi:hypothetical protein